MNDLLLSIVPAVIVGVMRSLTSFKSEFAST